jgi:hypothetical protein
MPVQNPKNIFFFRGGKSMPAGQIFFLYGMGLHTIWFGLVWFGGLGMVLL